MLREFVSSLVILQNRNLYPFHLDEDKQFDFKIQVKTVSFVGLFSISNKSKQAKHFQINDTFLNDCYFTTPLSTSIYGLDKQSFLINAITSHLITNYRTIVVGKTSAPINKMINTLAIFMPKELMRISCYALEENSMLSPYFCLQGFVTENPDDLNSILSSDFLFKRDSPTTVIDLSYKQVYRTAILNEFNALKYRN